MNGIKTYLEFVKDENNVIKIEIEDYFIIEKKFPKFKSMKECASTYEDYKELVKKKFKKGWIFLYIEKGNRIKTLIEYGENYEVAKFIFDYISLGDEELDFHTIYEIFKENRIEKLDPLLHKIILFQDKDYKDLIEFSIKYESFHILNLLCYINANYVENIFI